MAKTPAKQNRQPGIEAKMEPAPEYIKASYAGSGKLRDKVALITGGDSGIGRAVSIHFASEGGDVAIVYPDGDCDGKETQKLSGGEGRKCPLPKGHGKKAAFWKKAVS